MSPKITTILVVSMLALLHQAHAADRVVVLATSTKCEMETISALDIRKAYLGIGVSYGENSIRAFRLNNDAQLNQVFFQSVVVMSEKTYERRILLLLLKFGRPRPQAFESAADAAAAISQLPCGIVYMWQSDVEEQAGMKAIKILWQEN